VINRLTGLPNRLLAPFGYRLQRKPPFVRPAHRLKIASAPNRVLGPALRNKIGWEAPKSTAVSGDLHALWDSIPGGHKWLHYFLIYEELLASRRSAPVKVPELGVYRGGSLELWHKYFHSGSTIVGIDIDETCQWFDRPDQDVHVRIGSQADGEFLKALIDEFGVFDVIINDGSHMASHMIASFNHLFADGLSDDGVYVVEDTHSNYWQWGRDTRTSFVDLAKHVVDLMHYHYTVGGDELCFRIGSEARIDEFEVPRLTSLIREVRFVDSMIVFFKDADRTVPVSQHLKVCPCTGFLF